MYVLRKSPRAVAMHAGMLHVIPSFMIEPTSLDIDGDFSPTRQFRREYLEELFDRKDLIEATEDPDIDHDPVMEVLDELFRDGHAKLYFTGIAVNLLNLRPEICTLLWIDTQRWYRLHTTHPRKELRFRFNYEIMKMPEMAIDSEKAVFKATYKADDHEFAVTNKFEPAEFIPPGAAAVWLGKWLLDRILGRSIGNSGADSSAKLWIESWNRGQAAEPRPVSPAEADGLAQSSQFDLVIDERHRSLRSNRGSMTFKECLPLGRLGIWLTLACIGGVIEDSLISKLANKEDDADRDLLKKYPSRARVILRKLLGREVIPRGVAGEYEVRPDWSWLWIRSSQDRYQSRLRR